MNTRFLVGKILRGALVATVATAAVVGTANAGTLEPRQITVQYGDLNLASASGASQLYGRIRAAARVACGSAEWFAPLVVRQRLKQCRQDAIDDAVKSVNNTILTAMHDNKSPRSVG